MFANQVVAICLGYGFIFMGLSLLFSTFREDISRFISGKIHYIKNLGRQKKKGY